MHISREGRGKGEGSGGWRGGRRRGGKKDRGGYGGSRDVDGGGLGRLGRRGRGSGGVGLEEGDGVLE